LLAIADNVLLIPGTSSRARHPMSVTEGWPAIGDQPEVLLLNSIRRRPKGKK
jgi:hypothetical protein